MYIAQGQGQITTSGQKFDYNSFLTTLITHCKLQPFSLLYILRK